MTNRENSKSEDRITVADRLPEQDRVQDRIIEDGAYVVDGLSTTLDIPDGVAREGYEYFWARRDAKGMDDFRVEKMGKRAWRPVHAWRAKNYVPSNTIQDSMAQKYICRWDCVLVERLAKYRAEEDAGLMKAYNDRMRSREANSEGVGVKNMYNTPRGQLDLMGF